MFNEENINSINEKFTKHANFRISLKNNYNACFFLTKQNIVTSLITQSATLFPSLALTILVEDPSRCSGCH